MSHGLSVTVGFAFLTTLAIAGWRIRLNCEHLLLAERIADRYAAFCVAEAGSADATVMVLVDSGAETPISHWPANPVTRQGGICRFDVPGAYGTIALSVWQAMLTVERRSPLACLEQFLKVVCAYLALHRGGLLFHGAGLLVDEQVYLFTGPGGSGKSTTVTLSPQALALNDDLVVLRPDGACWWAFGTPFWNPHTEQRRGQTVGGPVSGIFKLVQDRRDFLEPIPTAIAIGELMANCPTVNSDPVGLPAVMNRCQELVKAVRFQGLHFRRSSEFWDLLRERNTN